MPRADAVAAGALPLHVILFSGGRGSGALTRQLVANPRVALTIAINGYDDGASTGEVRRFLRDSLGPSDFRKNASRLAAELHTCSPALIRLLDLRLPADATRADASAVFDACRNGGGGGAFAADVAAIAAETGVEARAAVSTRLDHFRAALGTVDAPFDFRDCSLGNLVFAGGYLASGRAFNRAVDDYCGLMGLPSGLVMNVTDGTNAWLVALDVSGQILATEEAIVDTGRANRIRDIFLLDSPLDAGEQRTFGSEPAATEVLERRSAVVPVNPRLTRALAQADLIIYAPGTQHSSLFPSYLTRGLSAAIAANLRAIKVLVTNIQPDAEIAGSSAVEIIERAVFYLKEKGRLSIPTPCLITHYMVNDPGHHEPERPYVPLGPLESIEDPRLVRIANYEDGVSGRHDASLVLQPFVDTLARRGERKRAAVLLHDCGSTNKVAQTLLEIVRGGIDEIAVDLEIYYSDVEPLDRDFIAALPFGVRRLDRGEVEFHEVLRAKSFDYAVLFESSGMYRGEDLVALASHLPLGRLDAVWGSRRLSVRDIEASYRLRYRRAPLLGAVSFLGSHLLSLAYLVSYGRYIADTLSGVRIVRAADAAAHDVDLTHKQANHLLLTGLLRRKADVLEIPVRFLPLSPERVRRTTAADGIRALMTIIRRRFLAPRV